jgi:hypothetical protein
MNKLRLLAGGLLVVWAAFWSWFSFAQLPPIGITLAVSGLLLVVPLLAWRWRRAGGMLLVLEGVGLLGPVGSFHRRADWTGLLILGLALPPLIAGLLLLAADGSRWKSPGKSSA